MKEQRTMPPKLYTLAETAAIFRVSKRVFAGFIADKPYYRTIGRAKLFTELDIAQLYEAMACPPMPASAQISRSARSEASDYARVAALMSKPPRKKSKPLAR
jgi:hypothetical protein